VSQFAKLNILLNERFAVIKHFSQFMALHLKRKVAEFAWELVDARSREGLNAQSSNHPEPEFGQFSLRK
jgi:hypothetical protein